MFLGSSIFNSLATCSMAELTFFQPRASLSSKLAPQLAASPSKALFWGAAAWPFYLPGQEPANSVGKVLPNFWRQVLVADQIGQGQNISLASASSMNSFVVHLGTGCSPLDKGHDVITPRLQCRSLLAGEIVSLVDADDSTTRT